MKNVIPFLVFVAISSALIVGFRAAGEVQRRGVEGLQLMQCLDRPWLDTTHGC